jgi:hypothetical protein
MALSDQLTDLAGRTKHLEDSAAAAREKNRTKLEQDREKLHSAVQQDAQSVRSSAEAAKSESASWWAGTTDKLEQQRGAMRAKIDERRSERKVEKAERNASDAEGYAADMVSFAAYAIDAAEYAVVDAAIARGEADDLTAAS